MSERNPDSGRSYFVEPRAHKFSFKPYDRRRVKRDLAAVHNPSYRLTAWFRRRARG